jgi:uncharacterized protein YggE
VDKVISQAIAILKSNGLPTTNYTTASIYSYPQYNYSNGADYIIGDQAYLSLSVTVGNLASNVLGNLATALSAVNNLTISGFTFTLYNSSAAYSLARKTAIGNAQQTAKQYASLTGLKLGAVRKVVDMQQ